MLFPRELSLGLKVRHTIDRFTSLWRWFRRDRIILLLATGVLLKSSVSPWYCVPATTLAAFSGHLYLTGLGRVMVGLLAVFCGFYALLGHPQRAPRLPVGLGLFLMGLFPYLLTTWCPTVTFIATDLLRQQEEVIVHLELNFPQVQTLWKQNISLHSAEMTDAISPFAIIDSRFFQVASLQDILANGLGYRNSFFALIGPGWGIGIIGLAMGLLALYLSPEQHRFQRFLNNCKSLSPGLILILGLLSLDLTLPLAMNHRLDKAFSLGQYSTVMHESQWLQTLYPPFQGDRSFQERLAAAYYYQDIPAPALTTFLQALDAYAGGRYWQAETALRNALASNPQQSLIRGYLATTLLNRGVQFFNNQETSAAIQQFEAVLEIFPLHVQALYNLMLAHVANGEFAKSALIAQQLIETQDYFQLSSPSLIGQANLHAAWNNFDQGDLDQAWQDYWESVQ